jgi:23S rRNA U2552 (ribose-2'-O)-methylase RlmE/FtsJ
MSTYYLLPRTNIFLYKNIEYQKDAGSPDPVISNSLVKYLYEIKEQLETQESSHQGYRKNRDSEWDVFKKYTNPYEYIDTIVPFKKVAVSKQKHLSRSYYKMIEIIHTFKLYFHSFENGGRLLGAGAGGEHAPPSFYSKSKTSGSAVQQGVSSFHLAEGPGGFIEAFAEIRNCKDDKYVGMTLMDDQNDPNIPAWKKTDAFLKKHPNVFIESGQDKTGNILSLENFTYCVDKYGSAMEFITGDGGFDFSIDFNNQENNISKLLFAQVCFALCLQKENGVFVLKVFDCFMQHTIDILYILSSFYEKVYVMKPQTSRYANSEKYIICKGFLFPDCKTFYPYIHDSFKKMMEDEKGYSCSAHRFLNTPVSKHFSSKLEEYNAIFGQQQIENIHYTLSIIENNIKQDKIHHLIKNNIQKCIQWCIKYNIEYNSSMFSSNSTGLLNTGGGGGGGGGGSMNNIFITHSSSGANETTNQMPITR